MTTSAAKPQNQDTLAFDIAGGPAAGTVTLDRDGAFTYTARHSAAPDTCTDLQDAFEVTVNDAHGGVLTAPVGVAASPTNLSPAISLSVSDADDDTGAVNVSVTVTDPDTDPVVYLVVHDPSHGTLAPSPCGGFIYTPTPQARDAAAGCGPDTDQFEIAAYDTHGGTATVPVSVEISPPDTPPTVTAADAATGTVPTDVDNASAREPQATRRAALTWQLVHAAPGALIYAAPVATAPTDPLRRARRGWQPSGSPAAGQPHPGRSEEHSALDYAGYLGRAGLLAVALGVGAALARTPGVASAEPTDTDSGTTSTSASASTEGETSTAQSGASSTSTATRPTTSSTGTSTGATTTTGAGPTVVVSSSGGAQSSTTATAEPSTTATSPTSTASPSQTSSTVSAPGSTSPPVVISSSGGAQTSTSESSTRPAAENPAPPAASSQGAVAEPTESPAAPPPAAPEAPATEAQTTMPQATTAPQTPAAPVSPTVPSAQPVAPEAAAVAAAAPAEAVAGPSQSTTAAPAAPPTGTVVPAVATPTAGTAAAAGPATPPALRISAPLSQPPTTATTTATTAAAAAPAATPVTTAAESATPLAAAPMPLTPWSGLNQVISTVLSPLTTPATTPTAQAAQTPVLFGVLAWVRRTFFNQTPTLTYNGQTTQVDNTVTGTLTAKDPDSPAPALTVTDAPDHGTVTVGPDGQFTYTVTDPDYIANGGPDTFTVTASDQASDFHIHGISGFLNAITFGIIGDPGHTATTTLNVAVITNAPPVVDPEGPPPPSEPDSRTGTVTGSFGVVDPEGDSLYTELAADGAPAYGTVKFDNAGNYTYVPNQAGHIRAGLDAGYEDSFTVNITQAPTQRIQIYVTNTDSNTVSAIVTRPAPTTQALTAGAAPAALTEDGFSQQVTIHIPIAPEQFVVAADPIPVSWGPAAVAVTTDGKRAYVTGNRSDTVQVIDTDPNSDTYNTVLDTIEVPHASAVAVSPDGQVYVTQNFGAPPPNSVSVIDTRTKEVIAIPVNDPWGVAVTPGGTRAYVANFTDGTVSVIDTASNTLIDTNPATPELDPIPVGINPIGVAVSPDRSLAYVTNSGDGTVSVIDTDTANDIYTVTHIITVGTQPTQVAVSPIGGRAYVVNRGDGTVSVIDTTSNTVIDTDPAMTEIADPIPVGNGPVGVAVSPDGSLAYVTNYDDGTVSVIDTFSNTVIGEPIAVGEHPLGVVVTPPDGNHIYVVCDHYYGSGAVAVLSIVSTAP